MSFDGNTLAIGVAYFPIRVYVFHNDFWELRESASQLDKGGNINEALALIALSSDGKSLFIAQTYCDLDTKVAFPFFEPTQTTFDNQQPSGVSLSPTMTDWLVDNSTTAIQDLDDNLFDDSSVSNSSICSSERYHISFGQLFTAEQHYHSFYFASLDLNLTLPPGSIQHAILAENGNLIITTQNGTRVYQKSC